MLGERSVGDVGIKANRMGTLIRIPTWISTCKIRQHFTGKLTHTQTPIRRDMAPPEIFRCGALLNISQSFESCWMRL